MAEEITTTNCGDYKTKLPKITYPRTLDGLQKKIQAMQKAGINTRKDAYIYTMLNLKSIELEMERLKGYEDNPVVAGLLERYTKLRAKWEGHREYTINNINEPVCAE